MRAYKAAKREQAGEKPQFSVEDAEGKPQVFVCRRLTAMDLSDMALAAEEDVTSPRAVAVLADFFRSVLTRDDYVRFRELIRGLDLDQEDEGELELNILKGVVEDASGRPTMPPSSSPDTQLRTGNGSTGGSSLEGFRVPEGFALVPSPHENSAPTPTSP